MASNFGNLAITVNEYTQGHFVVTLVMTQTNQGLNDFSKSISVLQEWLSIHGDATTSTITLVIDGFSYMISVNDLKLLTINNTAYTNNYAGALAQLNTLFNFTN